MNPRFLIPLLATSVTLACATSVSAGTYKNIRIDGAFDDWIGVPLAHEDDADTTTSADYRRIWIANDDDYLYLRFTVERPATPFTARENIFIDADADSSTGFALLVGSEMLIQGGAGYQEKNGGFNEGAITGLNWQAAPTGPATEFEVRIARTAVYASDLMQVFASPSIAVLLESEDANFARQETAPDSEGLFYDFAEPPPPFTGTAVLVPLQTSWSYRTATSDPGADWAGVDYDDTAAGWATGGALFGYTANPAAYPVPIATPLGPTPSTHYLRTRFNWNSNPSGVVFVATNYLSDGAVFHLNGAEVKRVRVATGDLTLDTPATGSPSPAGRAEVFTFPAGPMVEGENLLAVELHQNPATPADLVFGMSLFAAISYPATLPDPTLPADRAVVGGEPVQFSVEVVGSDPLTYSWMKDGQPLADATNAVFSLDAVLPEDAGAYSVRVSNPANPAGATSRSAILTVLSTPATITQAPVPLSLVEGESARFEVGVAGSAPIHFQWLWNGNPIEGATNASLELPVVRQADAGEYAVEVSNPVTTALRSSSARLTVAPDANPPSLVTIAGGPNEIVLTFSEPLDPVSAQLAANYSSTAGLTVSAAQLLADLPTVVVLQTSPQTLGTVYDLTVRQVQDRFGNALVSAQRRFLSSILVDGRFEDWTGVEAVAEDAEDSEDATDYARVWITNDSDYVYLRVLLHRPSDLGIFYNNIFLNTDGDAATGFSFRGIGSEMLIQGGGGYQQKGGAFNEGGILGLDWLIVPTGVATEFEIRFSRRATFASDGLPVFAADTLALMLESENTSFQTIDVVPDSEPIVHAMLNPPPAELGPLAIVRAGDRLRISWPGEGRLQSATALATGWQDVAGATSPYEVTPAAQPRFFRLMR